jgi:predicted cupin superfamily sugar epimerase
MIPRGRELGETAQTRAHSCETAKPHQEGIVHARPRHLIEMLDLKAHPEGGFYRELYRARQTVEREGTTRCALTSIYYLLLAGQFSQWHRVASDEVWHFYEGDALELKTASWDALHIERYRLGPLTADLEPVRVVPAGLWQAAQPLGAYTLVGCTVGPGFDFKDFLLLSDLSDTAIRDRLLAAR